MAPEEFVLPCLVWLSLYGNSGSTMPVRHTSLLWLWTGGPGGVPSNVAADSGFWYGPSPRPNPLVGGRGLVELLLLGEPAGPGPFQSVKSEVSQLLATCTGSFNSSDRRLTAGQGGVRGTSPSMAGHRPVDTTNTKESPPATKGSRILPSPVVEDRKEKPLNGETAIEMQDSHRQRSTTEETLGLILSLKINNVNRGGREKKSIVQREEQREENQYRQTERKINIVKQRPK